MWWRDSPRPTLLLQTWIHVNFCFSYIIVANQERRRRPRFLATSHLGAAVKQTVSLLKG